jgi:hypothetical protein
MKSKYLHQLMVLLCAGTIIAATAGCTKVRANELSLGPSSKQSGLVNIPLRKPAAFNFKTREEILNMRKQAIDANSNLLLYRYQPSPEIFNPIEDKKPWWGLAGQAVFGKGDKAITGLSEESRFVLNPYLLVAANSATIGIWDPKKLTAQDLNSDSFPYFWQPDQLILDPRNKRGSVSYPIRRYLQQINTSGKLLVNTMPSEFSLVAYNARDMGYHYILLDAAQSQNVANTVRVDRPVYIGQFIHCGGSCGYPGGCNNMSPFTREIDRCRLLRLPARAVVKLWKDRPFDNQEPDFVWTIDFK